MFVVVINRLLDHQSMAFNSVPTFCVHTFISDLEYPTMHLARELQ